MFTFKVQVAPYAFPTVHTQIALSGCSGDRDHFSEDAQRNYGVAFNVEDPDLWNAVNGANRTLPSKAGTARKYAPAILNADGETRAFTLLVEKTFTLGSAKPKKVIIA